MRRMYKGASPTPHFLQRARVRLLSRYNCPCHYFRKFSAYIIDRANYSQVFNHCQQILLLAHSLCCPLISNKMIKIISAVYRPMSQLGKTGLSTMYRSCHRDGTTSYYGAQFKLELNKVKLYRKVCPPAITRAWLRP